MLSDSVLKTKTDSSVLSHVKIEKDVVMKCFKEMCLALQSASKGGAKLKAIRKKYQDDRFYGVARFRIDQR